MKSRSFICREGRRVWRLAGRLAVLVALFSEASLAQTRPSERPPPSSEGTDVERRLPALPPGTPSVIPPAGLPPSDRPAVSADVDDTFVAAAIILDGATVFEPEIFVPLYRDLLARRIDRRDLAALTEAITNLYYEAGYTLTRAFVPPQDVHAGIITVRIAEGYVDRVTFEGASEVPDLVQRYAAAITAERPLRRATLERQILLLGDLYGARVDDARLRPIDAAEGRYELAIGLRHRSADYYGYLDNRGTRSYGPWQVWNSADVNHLGIAGWRLQGAFFTVPNSPQEVLYIQSGISRTLGESGTTLRTTLSGSENVAGRPAKGNETETSSRRLQLGITHPVQRSRASSLWTTLSFDALHSSEKRFKQRSFSDELRVVRPSAYYFFADGWGGETGINLEASFGLTMLGASPSGPERSRSDADTSFRKVRAEAWRAQSLIGPWSLYGQAAGQTSDHPLLASEEFSLGGARFGRGYDAAIISGDHGIAGALELRFTEPLSGRFIEYQLYGFYDVGTITNGNIDGNSSHHLASFGVGGRLTLAPAIRINLELAKPRHVVEGREDRDTRAFLTIAAGF